MATTKQKNKNPIIGFASKYFAALTVILSFTLAGTWFLISSQAAITPYFSGAAERDQTSRINSSRSSRGIKTLWHIDCLNNLSEKWSKNMATKNKLYHNSNFGGSTTNSWSVSYYCGTGWSLIGENVGYGSSSKQVYDAFMASSGHKANILNKNYNRMGVGVYVDANGRYWVTQMFAKCSSNCTNGKWNKTAVWPN